MKIKSYFRILLISLMMSGLLVSFATSARAGDGDGSDEPAAEEYEGSVSSNLLGATHSVPGGGYAWAQAEIGWTPLRADGVSKTGLSSGVTGTFSLCAKVTEFFKNSVPQGSSAQVCGARTGNGTVTSKKKVYEVPYGDTWRADTEHAVTASGFSWYPTQTVTYTIPWP